MNVVKAISAWQNPWQIKCQVEFRRLTSHYLYLSFSVSGKKSTPWIISERMKMPHMLCISVSVSYFHHTLTMEPFFIIF